ncbi:hypothetical protein [Paenibacillus alvei]|uniref:hypothetical protein n=1 Tax=Paenibacillus alvei TaxID=44250 RepID=UPI0010FD2B7C|nr:hypothetical protein [Paenibacillus alvei]
MDKIGVSYTWSPKGRLTETYAKLNPRLLDEDGKLNEDALDELWGGSLGLFKDGQVDQAMQAFREMMIQVIAVQNMDDFEELASCDILFELGEIDFALACLKTILSFPTDDRILPILEEFNERYDDIVFSILDEAKRMYEQYASSSSCIAHS